MAQLTLGIDISDEVISGVIVSCKGRDFQVVGCGYEMLGDAALLPGVLQNLLTQLDWKTGQSVLGISLAHFSLRNLHLPFTNEKKIEQILPFELEEHLLAPISEQVFSSRIIRQSEKGSDLLVAALEKQQIQHHLDVFNEAGLDPLQICISNYALAEYLCTKGHEQEFLFLYGDIGSMTLVVCRRQKSVFMRRLSYPETVFTDNIFNVVDNEVTVTDQNAARIAIHGLCNQIQKSLDRFSIVSGLEYSPSRIMFAGPMQLARGFQQQIEEELGLPCSPCNLVHDGGLSVSRQAAEKWNPAFYDRPLALALLGESKIAPLDFRKDEFALPSHLLGSRKQVISLALAALLVLSVGIGYLFIDYRASLSSYDQLATRMEQVFRKSFPGATRIVDPLMQMRASLEELQAPTVSMPLFTREQRILAILADISSRVPGSISLHVSRLVVDEDSVKIKGTTDAFNNVNTIKKLLAESPRYQDVSIVSATKSKEKDTIRFEIRLQLEGNS